MLAPGAFADVNVIDLENLQLLTPGLVADFPLGARRFVQRARGYDYTLVNGQVLADHDELTEAPAGPSTPLTPSAAAAGYDANPPPEQLRK